ncbi:MAG: GSCFA domain-containing protein, partial [Pararhodobacter sp.]|nr:GSCFA domain-containing protein [Pararhodobacter sp.]
RPRIEPDGFASVEEMTRLRQVTIDAFRDCISDARLFVFTLGLTESWVNAEGGYEYPMCPGTAGGTFDPDRHQFRNQSFDTVRAALEDAIHLMREINPTLRFLLTVSPVPLTATMSGQHVVTATMESKSILRAVAGDVARRDPFIDYFPSYEIINSPAFRGVFFDPNMRTVNPRGVDFVMRSFFTALERKFDIKFDGPSGYVPTADDLKCEEAALAAFAEDT